MDFPQPQYSTDVFPRGSWPKSHGLTVGGLFSGIGGCELGFREQGFHSSFLCEIDSDARSILGRAFPDVECFSDIRKIESLPAVDVLVGGFPCQDLSAVGPRRGLSGNRSSVVKHVFRLLAKSRRKPGWVVLENVPFMLTLKGGSAVKAITSQLEQLGYSWAYRIVNSRAFGLPQRRRRVIIVAGRGKNRPEDALFADDYESAPDKSRRSLAHGFYWTEGNTGVGWAIDSIPALKGGSGLSIPSPPAIWKPWDDTIVTPDIRDAERLQGFPAEWTSMGTANPKLDRRRWRMVGNAVSVPVASWIASRIREPGNFDTSRILELKSGDRWPAAASGGKNSRYAIRIGELPAQRSDVSLRTFLNYPGSPLSERAAKGFLSRAVRSSLRFTGGFLEAVGLAAGLSRARTRRAIANRFLSITLD